MKTNTMIGGLFAILTVASTMMASIPASAQRWDNQDRRYYRDNEYDRRQKTKNEWRNIAIGAGALGVLGLLNHDSTLTFAGAAGALYSANRYEQDRKSQNSQYKARAEYFSRPYFYRDGTRYNRRTVNRNGQKYYQFYRP